jgi:hypothetical protein
VWNASLVLDGFADIVSVLAPGHKLTGPRLSIAELFDPLPLAVLQARHAPAKNPLMRPQPSGIRAKAPA